MLISFENNHCYEQFIDMLIHNQTRDSINNVKSNNIFPEQSEKNIKPISTQSTSQMCFGPLGMEHGHISDEHISASSAFDYKSVGPHNAR